MNDNLKNNALTEILKQYRDSGFKFIQTVDTEFVYTLNTEIIKDMIWIS